MLIKDGPEPRDEDELEGLEPADADEPEAGDEVETPADDDEPDADVIDVDDEPEPEPEPRKPAAAGKGKDENMAALRERARAERERAERAEAALRDREQPAVRRTEDPEAEARRIAAMTPEQRLDYKQAKFEERMTRESQISQFNTWNTADKARYDAKASVDPRYRRFADQVERELGQAQKNGLNFNREQVLAFIIGNQVMNAKGSKGAKKQAAEAEASVRENKVRPSRPKGDTAPDRSSNERTARRKRLEGQQI